MGRRLFLERLVLGRSAFDDLELNDEGEASTSSPQPNPNQNGRRYHQQYDSKGRPTNPATDKTKRQERHAQNAILELVGVVERKERGVSELYSNIRQARNRLLQHEHDFGEDLDLAQSAIQSGLTWFPQTMMARVQAGIYSFSLPFADIVLSELGRIGGGGWRTAFATVYPGAVALSLCSIVEVLLYELADHIISRIELPLMRRATRKQLRHLDAAIQLISEACYTAIDILLLPLSFHGNAQMLGVAPFYPLLPPVWPFSLIWPTSRILSYHSILWAPLLIQGPLRYVSYPAVLLLALKFIQRTPGDERSPIASQLTTFRYPAVNGPPTHIPQAHKHDILHSYFKHGYIIRATLMRCLGYPLQESSNTRMTGSHPNALHNNTFIGSRAERHHVWRSTALSLMPPQFISTCIDGFFSRVLTLGLESTVYRAITSSYLAVPELPKTILALSAVGNYYVQNSTGAGLAPFGAWVFGWKYLNKLGLSVMFCYAAEAAGFFAVYGIVRWQGTTRFGWENPEGRRSRREIGGYRNHAPVWE